VQPVTRAIFVLWYGAKHADRVLNDLSARPRACPFLEYSVRFSRIFQATDKAPFCHRLIAGQQEREQIQTLRINGKDPAEICVHCVFCCLLLREFSRAEHFSPLFATSSSFGSCGNRHLSYFFSTASLRQLLQHMLGKNAPTEKLSAVPH
jgi:hypothetical protein